MQVNKKQAPRKQKLSSARSKTSVISNGYMQTMELDCSQYVPGRAFAKVSRFLSGKCDVRYSPHVTPKNSVVFKNVDQLKYSANKDPESFYYTGYIGGRKSNKMSFIKNKNPKTAIIRSLKNMCTKRARKFLGSTVKVEKSK